MMMTPKSFLYSRTPQQQSSPCAQSVTTKTSSSLKRKDGSPTKNGNLALIVDASSNNLISRQKISQSRSVSAPSGTSPTKTMSTAAARPVTPSSAVQIPVKSRHDVSHKHKARQLAGTARNHSPNHTSRNVHSPDAIPPSVAALLAITNIPHPPRRTSQRQKKTGELRMTVDSIVPRSKVSEKDLTQELCMEIGQEYSLTYADRSPMDILLSPPDDLEEDELSVISDSGFASNLSTRAQSLESIPSLGDSLGTSVYTSVDSPVTPRGRRFRPPRRSLEPVMTSPEEQPIDPLSKRGSVEIEDLDFRVFSSKAHTADEKQTLELLPLKSVFKSNLTASLRALRSAAKTLSSFTASSIPPDDLLTRSILTLDPRVPFTDERRPPVLEEEPSDAMRRYLNPTSSLRSETRGTLPTRSYTASIQMQTYKVQRSRGTSPPRRPAAQPHSSNKFPPAIVFSPGPRQREMRENSDFIRIAVMEHLMRKRGKLDDQREGHARWLLPPRKTSARPYEIGPGGVPARWMPMYQELP